MTGPRRTTSDASPCRGELPERGAASLLLIAVVVVAAALVVALGPAGGELATRARVEAIADVGALAAATGGEDAASAVVEGSGARLLDLRADGPDAVTVVVGLDRHRASAAATTAPPADEPVGGR